MISNILRRCVLFVAVGLLVGTSLVTYSAEPNDIVKYRQSIMLSQRGHLAAATAIIHGKVAFKDHLSNHVKSLEATVKTIPNLFPKDSNTDDTKAQDAVWKNNAEFLKRAKVAREKAHALTKAVASGDKKNYAPRLKDLQDACKACHKDFRKEEAAVVPKASGA